MSYQVLARKWRPKSFDQMVGQDHIKKALVNAISSDRVAQAYLFTGTRGVGKTTAARILAKSLLCQDKQGANPCLKCSQCLSVDHNNSLNYIEIDGASNNGVENIRELVENVAFLPSSGTRKIYVIDEVHMLSTSAFNALLKTLEEPPEHVVFIFATTDPQKLLGTVLSRCQRFDFNHVSKEIISNHLRYICEQETIEIDNESLDIVSKFADGSIRDSLSLLDQVLSLSTDNKVDIDLTYKSLGLARVTALKKCITAIISGDKSQLVKSFNNLVTENIDLKKFYLQICDTFFDAILTMKSSDNTDSKLVEIEQLKSSSVVELMWIYEVLAKELEWVFNSSMVAQNTLFTLIKVCEREQLLGIKTQAVNVEKEVKKKAITNEISKPVEKQVEKTWEGFLNYLSQTHLALASNVRSGNLIEPLDLKSQLCELSVGFKQSDKVFFDYLQNNDAKKTVKEIAQQYFENYEQIIVSFKLLESKEGESFLNQHQVEQKKEEEKRERKIEQVKNDNYVQLAQSIFKAQVKDIKLKEN